MNINENDFENKKNDIAVEIFSMILVGAMAILPALAVFKYLILPKIMN